MTRIPTTRGGYWLELHRMGCSIRDIAKLHKINSTKVHRAIQEAKSLESTLMDDEVGDPSMVKLPGSGQ